MIKDIIARIRDRELYFGLSGKMALYTFPLLGILGALALVALKQYKYLILSIYILIPIITAPLAYMLARGTDRTDELVGDAIFKYMVAGYLIGFAISLILLYAFEIRPVVYYCVIAAMASIILVQILRYRITRGISIVILLQIVALVLNISWGITLKYYEFTGRTDILVHTYYVNSVIQLGHVTSIFFDYESFPLWHIMNAGIYLAGGAEFPTHKVMAITGGLAFAMMPIVIYLIGRKLFKDDRTALIAALITILFPDLVSMASSSIPRIIAGILMVFLIYMLLAKNSRSCYLLIIPMTAAIIIYHSISILLISQILIILYILQMLFVKKNERFVSIWYVMLAIAMTIVYWLINAGTIIDKLIHNATADTDGVLIPKALTENMPWNELFNYLQYIPAILFILVGIFMLLLSSKHSNRARIFGLAALLLVGLSFPGPLLMIGKLVSSFGIDRIAEYTFLIMILVAAVGIVGLFNRSGRLGKSILIGLFAIWVLLSVSNDWVASDNPLVKRPFYTYYFSEQEITGMDRLVTHATGILESDYVPDRYFFASPYYKNRTVLEVDMPNMTFVRSGPNDVLLIREGEHEKRELRGAALDNSKFLIDPEGGRFIYIGRNLSVWSTLAENCCVYDSRAIRAYTG